MIKIGSTKNYKKRVTPLKAAKDAKQDRQIATLKRQVRAQAPEVKWYTTPYQLVPVQSGSMAPVNLGLTAGVVLGNSPNTRVGNTIKVKQIRFRIMAYQDASFLQAMRIIMYRSNDPIGAPLAPADLLLNYNAASGNTQNMLSTINHINCSTGLYKSKKLKSIIMYDKVVTFPAVALTGNPTRMITYNKVFKTPIEVGYNNAATDAGQIVVAVFPGLNTTTANNPFWSFEGHVFYTDA